MSSYADSPALAAESGVRTDRAAVLPWEVTVLIFATTLVGIGLTWDISWHETIGRDSFWTPAHVAVYLGGTIAGFVAGWMALRATYFGGQAQRDATVGLWGARAPYGAWITIWGAAAMLTSAPFDNWWHNAYGLDVKIISPPHILLFAGVLMIRLGVWLTVLREQNRPRPARGAAGWYVFVGGLMEASIAGVFLNEFIANREHGWPYLLLAAAILPLTLTATAQSTKLRWGTTLAAATYMLYVAGSVWILPLFPGSPRLGPIYNPVTHMVPPPFPQWIIVPAFAIDLIRARMKAGVGAGCDLLVALVSASAFLALFFPVQWRFSSYLLSPAGNNWIFAGERMWSYNTDIQSARLTRFWDFTHWPPRDLALAFVLCVLSSFLGARFGSWMSRVRR